jgi:hypothetical protein
MNPPAAGRATDHEGVHGTIDTTAWPLDGSRAEVLAPLTALSRQAVPPLAPHLEKARSERGGQPLERPPQQSAPMSRAGANGSAI